MSVKIFPLNAYKDNYIWVLLNKNNQLIIVDPGDATPVLNYLEVNPELTLSGILITHKHWDHCNGAPELLKNFSVPVFGPTTKALNFITHPLTESDGVQLNGFPKFSIMEIPGHTLEHIAYYNNKVLFCGDTLFTGGCGRIFEGTPYQMFQTLTKLTSLPEDILVYCGHEYTLNNLKFARCVEPNNSDLLQRYDACEKLSNNHLPTVPSTLQLEKLTNPFLRCHIDTVRESVQKHYQKELNDTVEIFAHCRKWKDGF